MAMSFTSGRTPATRLARHAHKIRQRRFASLDSIVGLQIAANDSRWITRNDCIRANVFV